MSSSKILIGLSAVVASAVLFHGCVTQPAAKTETAKPKVMLTSRKAAAVPSGACRPSLAVPDRYAPDLLCAAPPSTFDDTGLFGPGVSPATMAATGPMFDSWAWASFAAFNWPALASASQPTGYLRGIPDLNQSFGNASGTEVLVWETFKEKREVFNSNVTASGWQQLTFPPDQGISIEGGQIPPCSESDRVKALKLPGGHRRILQASKLAPALVTGPNSLDETAEVASPAQESQNALCAGYTATTNPTLAQCQATYPVPPGGNSASVYSPLIINPRPGVGPRVFDPSGNLVYYEVRVNYDYFNYVLANGLNYANPIPQTPPAPAVPAPPYSLPWRTSAIAPPKSAQSRLSTVNYDANATVTAYGTFPITPPTIGSVQVKSAWKMLSFADPTYHTTDAVYFTTKASVPGNTCYAVGTFGLIALHIIQRVHMGFHGIPNPPPNADPVGGTFIFATWEHNSIGNGGGYRYISFLSNGGVDQSNPTPYPAVNYAIPVQRQQPYPLASTNQVTQAVYNELPPNSVWKNYRLIGTQFYANVTPASSLAYNQPYYMANLVVETNNGLQNFQGLPPNVTAISQYNGFTPTGNAYNPNVPNVSFNGNAQLMGGCMGCHGVAQIKGSNFSFVLLDGQKGAGIDTPTVVAIPPSPPPSN